MIFDYLKDQGSVSFEGEPLNYLDALIFAELAYFDYPQPGAASAGAGEDGSALALPDALAGAKHVFGGTYPEEERLFRYETENDERLRAEVSQAPRYAQVQLLDFDSNYKKNANQFAAVSYKVGDVLIVAYRGTDESFSGWGEALRLSYDKAVPGQELAAAFLRKQAEKTNGPVVVCGHSKGGNFAGYAAALAASDEQLARRIACVISFDGPGLSWRVRQKRGYQALTQDIAVFIPRSSIVGNIHGHPYGTVRYIEAREVFLAQHDVFTWETKGNYFVPCKQALDGRLGSAALNVLVKHLNDSQKDKLFNVLFALIKRVRK